MVKKILIGLLAVLIVIQFVRPGKNVAAGISAADISKTYEMPENIHSILMKKCYDCHSNNTIYPWYSNIQPVGWWLASHVNEGKEHLDFSDFKNYPEKKANHKLEELMEVATEGSMPLDSYLWLHHDARLESSEVEAINAWVKSLPITFEEEH
jgi:hypothetical protein